MWMEAHQLSMQLKSIAFFKVPCGDVALVEKYLFQEISNKHPGVASLQEISCAVTYNAAKGRVTCLTPAFLQL